MKSMNRYQSRSRIFVTILSTFILFQSGLIADAVGQDKIQAPHTAVLDHHPVDPANDQSAKSPGSIESVSISASDGTTDYSIAVTYSSDNPCVFPETSSTTLTATDNADSSVDFTTSFTEGSGTWTVYPGPGKSYNFKLSFSYTGFLCDGSDSATNNGSTTALKAPKNVTATANGSDQNVTVGWSAGTDITDDRGVLFYYIYKNGSFITSRGLNDRSYTGTTTPNTTDDWSVATRFSGYTTTPGATSAQVSASAATAAFKTPASLAVTDGTTVRSIELSWTQPSDYADNTYIYRDGQQIASVSAGTQAYSDTKIIPGDPYDYCVSNYNGIEETGQECAAEPGRSFFVHAEDGTDSKTVRLDWTDLTGKITADDIRVLRDGLEIAVLTPATATTFTDIQPDPGVVYQYDVNFRSAGTSLLEDFDYGFIPADGEILGMVQTEGVTGGGVRDVRVTATPALGEYQFALALDGVNDYVSIDHRQPLSPAASFTIEIWVNPSEIREQSLIGKGTDPLTDPYGLTMDDTGVVTFTERGGAVSVSSSDTLAAGTWTHLAVVQDASANTLSLYLDGDLDATTALSGTDGTNFEPLTFGARADGTFPFAGTIDEIRLWSVARTDSALTADMYSVIPPITDNLVAYWPFFAGEGTTAADEALGGGSHGVLVGNPEWTVDNPGVTPVAFSDNLGQGEFRFTGLRYENSPVGTLYEVRPTKENHAFDPAESFKRLTDSDNIAENTNFTDTTSVSVSGSVLFADSSCPVDSAEVRIDGIPSAFTDGNGLFAIGGIERGEHEVSTIFRDHPFSPVSTTINFTGDVSDLQFDDTATQTLSGFVAGGTCRADIGRARITITGPDGCSTTTVETTDRAYSLMLPAQKYTVSVEMLDDPSISFVSQSVDLTDADQTLDFTYFAPPEITLSGFPTSSCESPVLEQGQIYEILADIHETYPQETCAAEVGTLDIFDEIGDGVAPVSVELDSLGIQRYYLTAGLPNIVGGGPSPYQKRVSFVVSTAGGDLTAEQSVIVEGNRPREQTFTTVSPQLPMLILRDPPGDDSYSFKEQSVQTCYAAGFSLLNDASVGVFTKIKAGTKFETEIFGISFETKVWGEIGASIDVGARLLNQNDREICLTQTNEYATSGNEEVTGTSGDVFVGSAMNIVYALTDVLEVDETASACVIDVSQDIIYDNAGFATQYHYTESHIRNTIIPDLEINRDLATNDDDRQNFEDQIEVWNNTLALNEDLKERAVTMGEDFNLSFSANAPRTEFTEWEVTDKESIEFNLYIESEVARESGIEIGGVGASGGVRVRAKMDVGASESLTTTTTNKTGFFLGDDDEGDAFTVDVKRDLVYGTPVFALVSGVSSYPWEEGTLPRDGVDLTLSPVSQTISDPDAAAEVILSLGNTGQNTTPEARNYELVFLQESNPFGAVLTIGGSPVVGPIPYTLDQSESRQVTLRLSRAVSSSVYDFDDLQVVLRSPDDAQIADTASFAVHFESPCTAITLAEPLDGWLVNYVANDSLRIFVRDYDKTNLQSISFETSPAGRNTWTPAFVAEAGELPDDEAVLFWKTGEIDDDAYDFRAVAECSIEGTAASTASAKASGVIDRVGPKLFGTPEPANGVLGIGDVFNATFDEPLSCDAITSDNVLLKSAETGSVIAADVACDGKSLVVSPTDDLGPFENKSIQVTLASVEDAHGNDIGAPITWAAVVNQNALYWAPTRITASAYQGASVEITGKIVNGSAKTVTYSLTSFPDWLEPISSRGTVDPGGSEFVKFATSSSIIRGKYDGIIVLTTDDGAEPLDVELNVSCEAPPWAVNPADFAHSMSITGGYYLDGVPYSGENDLVAAFVDGEVRGVTTVQKVVPQDEYAAFLTAYSHQSSGDELSFILYDASECLERTVSERVDFQADAVQGTATDLAAFNVTGALLQTVEFVEGWTWISFGVEAGDMTPNAVLNGFKAPEGTIIKGQTSYGQYVGGKGWVGSLDTLQAGATYKLQSDVASSLQFIGEPIDASDRPLPIVEGWNWVGYLPDGSMDVNEALSSLVATASADDVIKSQFAFATFDGTDWTGALGVLTPGEGYLLRAEQAGSLVYPNAAGKSARFVTELSARQLSNATPPDWSVNAAGFEHSMTVTANLILPDGPAANSESILAAFVDGEVRGVARPAFVLDQWMFFLTVYGEVEGESVTFRAYDADSEEVVDAIQSMEFKAEST